MVSSVASLSVHISVLTLALSNMKSDPSELPTPQRTSILNTSPTQGRAGPGGSPSAAYLRQHH